MTLALLTLTFLAGCAPTSQQRLAASARTVSEAGLVDQALAVAQLPALPDDCRRWQASGVTAGERLDAALVKTDQALTQANLRVRRCSGWYDGLTPQTQ